MPPHESGIRNQESREEIRTRPEQPAAATDGAGFVLTGEPAKKPGRAKSEKPPLPFKPIELCQALEKRQPAWFASVEDESLDKGLCIGITKNIRKFPDMSDWMILADWISAGGLPRMQPFIFPGWVASGSACQAMVEAKGWASSGRPDLVKARVDTMRRVNPYTNGLFLKQNNHRNGN